MEEQQKKNELGNIYGSRVSKNGKWLNLLIVTHTDGKEVRITCPIRLVEDEDEKTDKPRAWLEKGIDAEGREHSEGRAVISNIRVYEDKKPSEAQAAAEDSDLPF